MIKNPPDDMAQIIPYLYYDDAGSAIEFMESADSRNKRPFPYHR